MIFVENGVGLISIFMWKKSVLKSRDQGYCRFSFSERLSQCPIEIRDDVKNIRSSGDDFLELLVECFLVGDEYIGHNYSLLSL